jgi:D-methionine transport system permease protein
MTLISSAISYLIGIPLGVILVVTDKDGIAPCNPVHTALGVVINIFRSIPFLILLVMVLPLTKFLVGTTLGPKAIIPPLIIASAPYIGRMVESSLKEVSAGVIEAAKSMGASNWQIIYKVLIPEAKPSLLVGAAICITTILSYSAMAGFVGGGGLGAIALNYGYYRYKTDIMMIAVVILVVLVQIIQEFWMRVSRATDKRARN